ncbi:hypothetical protein EJF36_13255 [Bacillus sp. HMF5848]|uniref:hypothetical protein n=1 Tax=Bacillus sp. HMF5848 TaxID=2495421 RepID=UPI000F7A3F33|nr:hypothetical protein [Bacillus sp. HMF5848]RSK27764.1 hypothetical protein EJF36_13255 [Bacillus sp. HMF5848]
MNKTRYKKGILTAFNINIAQLRSPNAVMWWSAAMPGFGHIMICKYLRGFLLIIWEFIVNINAHLNLAIFYTFLGRYEEAIQVLDTNWILLYVPVYLFSIWDSGRVAIDINKYAILADTNGSVSEIEPISFSALENNYLDKFSNKIAIFWSFVFPGLGHLYIGRTPSGFYIIVWMVIVVYFSNLLTSIHLTFTGNVYSASQILNPEWLIFLPSMYCFAAYDAYQNCDSFNHLMKQQQDYYLINKFQNKSLLNSISFLQKEVDGMNIIGSFDNSLYVELAINELREHGLSQDKVLAIPLTEVQPAQKTLDILKGDVVNLNIFSFAFGTIFSLFGVIYGFVLIGGPVTWGLLSLFIGLGVGYVVDLIRLKKQKSKKGGVFVIVQCNKENVNQVKEILFNNCTNGLHVIQ